MGLPLYLVDAFANRAFTGNPAAVCLLTEPMEDHWMQNLAMEMNQAETAFVLAESNGFRLRWFTPNTEVDLCGHATLAASHALWESGIVPKHNSITFHTKSGELKASRNDEAEITLDFPSVPAMPQELPEGLLVALGMTDSQLEFTGKNLFDYLVVADNETTVRNLTPDLHKLTQFDCRGIIVTANSDISSVNFVSRFFAPACGVPEDPVTGSAHCCLAPYWCASFNASTLIGYQASRRGGYVRVELCGDRVMLSGRAITTIEGILR